MQSVCEDEDLEWDEFIAQHPEGHHEQSSGFARNRIGSGFQCDRVIIRSNGRIVGGGQVLAKPNLIGTQALILRAPLALRNDSEVLDKVVDGFGDLAKRRNFASIRIETFPTQVASREALLKAGYLPSDAWDGVRPTVIVQLEHTDKDLLARMKPKGRYNVRLAERLGVTVSTGDSKSLNDFFRLHKATALHQGFPVFERSYFDYVWRIFYKTGRVQLFLAYHLGKPIAGILNTIVGSRLYYGWGGMNREPACKKLMANYLLHFYAMCWARDHGCTHYDLVGVTEFKEKLAQDEVQWPYPQVRYFGSLCKLRRSMSELTWTIPMLRKGAGIVSRRLYPEPPLPY